MTLPKKTAFIYLILAFLIGLGVLGYAWSKGEIAQIFYRPPFHQEKPKIQESEEPEVIESDIDTSSWLTYRNGEYGFEVKYPEGWYVKSYQKGIIFFNDKPFPEKILPEPIYPVSVFIRADSSEDVIIQGLQNIMERKAILIRDQRATQIIYFSDILNSKISLVLINKENNLYGISGSPDNIIYKEIFKSFRFIK